MRRFANRREAYLHTFQKLRVSLVRLKMASPHLSSVDKPPQGHWDRIFLSKDQTVSLMATTYFLPNNTVAVIGAFHKVREKKNE